MSPRRWHRASAWAWILLLTGVALFVRLGFWQLDRAQQKTALLGAFNGAESAPLQPFAVVRNQTLGEKYPHTTVLGRFDALHSYMLDNQMHDGHAGVLVFAVLVVDGSSQGLLVNRGWIIRADGARSLPPIPPVPIGEVELQGLYAPFPGSGIRLGGNALPGQTQWPKLATYLDPDELRLDIGRDLYSRQLLQDPEPESEFVRDWKPAAMPPERHRAYAAQWFALALAALVVFIVLHYRKVEKN